MSCSHGSPAHRPAGSAWGEGAGPAQGCVPGGSRQYTQQACVNFIQRDTKPCLVGVGRWRVQVGRRGGDELGAGVSEQLLVRAIHAARHALHLLVVPARRCRRLIRASPDPLESYHFLFGHAHERPALQKLPGPQASMVGECAAMHTCYWGSVCACRGSAVCFGSHGAASPDA